MSKSKENKTKPLLQKLTEKMNKYDGTNYIYDGSDNTINTEADMKKKFSAQEKYRMYKQFANNQEKKEFRDIERKYKKKSSIDQRTVPFSKKDGTGGAVKIDITALPKINPFNIPQDPKPKRIQQIRSKAELGGLAYLLGEYND